MRKLNLQLFAANVTVYKDGHMTTASASPSSSVASGTEVTLTLTPESGYEVDDVEVISGGVTVNLKTKKFTMGSSAVVLYVKSKANNLYKVTETCEVIINGGKTTLAKNVTVVLTPDGVVSGVECEGTAITLNDAVQQLIDQGILVKM